MTPILDSLPAYLALALVLGAAVFDTMRFEIPDWVSIVVVVLAAMHGVLHPGFVWWSHLLAPFLMFGFGLLAFARGWLGGGDVKLMTALAGWTGVLPIADPVPRDIGRGRRPDDRPAAGPARRSVRGHRGAAPDRPGPAAALCGCDCGRCDLVDVGDQRRPFDAGGVGNLLPSSQMAKIASANSTNATAQ